MFSIEDIEGIGPATAEKLRNAGINSVEALAVTPVRMLVEEAEITEEKANEITQSARKMLDIKFMTATEFMKHRTSINKITTGVKAFDELLGGGIETQSMTELIGEFGSGKTQICHQLCATVQLPPERGGLNGKAVFIDTEGTFRPERVSSVARDLAMDPVAALNNVIYARAYNSDHQLLLTNETAKMAMNENIKLIIVDSVITHFRSEYPGREALAQRQQKLNGHLHQLLRTADVYGIAVVVTNQIQSTPDTFFGNPNKPAGGNVLAHGSTYRIWLRKSKESRRIARIIDSPMHPEGECVFMITENGLKDMDVPDK